MSVQSTLDYYSKLLILQYAAKVKAQATIQAVVAPVLMPETLTQTINFPGIPAGGTFKLSYNGNLTAAINWNDGFAAIQTKLQAVYGLGTVTVSGSIALQQIQVTFTSVDHADYIFLLVNNSLVDAGALPVTPIILTSGTDGASIPLSVMGAFNIKTAIGKQLDILGKYAGVLRDTFDFTGPVSLTDADYRILIQLKIIQNNAYGSLYDIQTVLHDFFPGSFLVFDGANMHMGYFFESTVGSVTLAEVLVKQNLLPKPMGVQLAALVYAAGISSFFGMANSSFGVFNGSTFPGLGLSDSTNYNTSERWLADIDAIAP